MKSTEVKSTEAEGVLRLRATVAEGRRLGYQYGDTSTDRSPRFRMPAFSLADHIRSIDDFPKPGIRFRDITPLLSHGPALKETIRQLAEPFRGQKIDVVGAAEARGFIFAAPLAIELGVGFVPFRKPGKLPFDTHSFHYELEYGTDSLEVHIDGFSAGQRVLLVDDLLATGGTMAACCKLVENCGATVAGCAFVIELTGLGGAKILAPHTTFSLLKYE